MLLRCSRLQSNPGFERVAMNRPLLCFRRGGADHRLDHIRRPSAHSMTALMHSGNFYWIKEYFLSMLLQGKISIFVRWQRGRLREDENPKAKFP